MKYYRLRKTVTILIPILVMIVITYIAYFTNSIPNENMKHWICMGPISVLMGLIVYLLTGSIMFENFWGSIPKRT